MSEKPILFNTEMVRAILSGRKTQTRRVAFPERDLREFRSHKYPNGWWYRGNVFRDFESVFYHPDVPKCKYRPGDVLWVRETWKSATGDPAGGGYALFDTYVYKADGKAKDDYPVDELMVEDRWHPSIHMPRQAARIFLLVKDVRVERLQEITVAGLQSEGVIPPGYLSQYTTVGCAAEWFDDFKKLWEGTIKKADLPLYGWDANPWVWVINFEKIDRPEAQT